MEIFQTSLADWVELLNCLDTVMEIVLSRWKSQIILVENVSEPNSDSLGLGADLQCLKSVLKFTTALLKQTINKDVYSSVEV